MNHKKALPNDIDRFFAGKSIFFGDTPPVNQPTATPPPNVLPDQGQSPAAGTRISAPTMQRDERPHERTTAQAQLQESKGRHSPALPASPSPTPPSYADENQTVHESSQPAGTTDVMGDGMTSLLQGVKLKAWQEVIENTETQNSALRLTSAERYAIEDVVNELRRQEKIKTSMNEIVRLGLLLLIHDFKQNKQRSLLYRVKKA